MHFEKFDICEAYWCFYAEWGHDAYTWKICAQLDRLKFRPRPSLSSATLEENGKEIYLSLVAKHYPDRVEEIRAELLEEPA